MYIISWWLNGVIFFIYFQALTNLISNRLSPVTALSYGTEASRCLMLEQARLLVEIAASVYAIPRNLKTQ